MPHTVQCCRQLLQKSMISQHFYVSACQKRTRVRNRLVPSVLLSVRATACDRPARQRYNELTVYFFSSFQTDIF